MSYHQIYKLPSSTLFSDFSPVTNKVGPALVKDKSPPSPPIVHWILHPFTSQGLCTMNISSFTGSFHSYANMLLFLLFKNQNNKNSPDPHIICQLSPFYFTSKHAYFSCLHCLTFHSLLYYDLVSVPTTLLRRLLSRSPMMT